MKGEKVLLAAVVIVAAAIVAAAAVAVIGPHGYSTDIIARAQTVLQPLCLVLIAGLEFLREYVKEDRAAMVGATSHAAGLAHSPVSANQSVNINLHVADQLKTLTQELSKEDSKAKVIEAERFIVRDSAGRPRAVFGVMEEGAILSILDKDGKLSTIIGDIGDGFGLIGLLEHGKLVTSINCRHGKTALNMADGQGNLRMEMVLGSDGEPMIGLYDPLDRANVRLVMTSEGGGLFVMDQQQRNRVVLFTDPDGSPTFALLGKDGKPL